MFWPTISSYLFNVILNGNGRRESYAIRPNQIKWWAIFTKQAATFCCCCCKTLVRLVIERRNKICSCALQWFGVKRFKWLSVLQIPNTNYSLCGRFVWSTTLTSVSIPMKSKMKSGTKSILLLIFVAYEKYFLSTTVRPNLSHKAWFL